MTKKTTRNNEYSENQLVLFLAMELGATKWELAFSTGFDRKARRRTIEAGNTSALQAEIAAAKYFRGHNAFYQNPWKGTHCG